jgi:phenylpropionate dioxygenase-like ring-hydroxylating dioxygenase large terminal subunit
MGELFRRFWLPALLAEELPGPDCEPVRLRLLGEDLIAFKDSDGKVGILDAYCPHRSAPMFFARNEDCGLRCVYHGWKFDVDGNCLDMPNTVEGETFKERVKTVAYPTFEAANMIWIYMGPREHIPPKPAFPFMNLPRENVYVMKYLLNCNYAQTLENEFDTSHSAFLHSTLNGDNMTVAVWSRMWDKDRTDKNAPSAQPPRRVTRMAEYTADALGEIVDTPFGSALVRRVANPDGDRHAYFMSIPYWMPCYSAAGALSAPGVFPLNLKVPVDDEHSVFFRFKWSEDALPNKVLAEMKHGGYEFPQVIPGTYVPLQNKSNDYMIDRVKQRFFNYSGIMNTPVQDFAVTENQRGPITDRTRERLVSADKYLIHVRRRLMDAARALQNGVEPEVPHNATWFSLRMPRRIEVPAETSFDEAVQLLLDPSLPQVSTPQVQKATAPAVVAD